MQFAVGADPTIRSQVETIPQEDPVPGNNATAVITGVRPPDRDALVAIYNAMGGPNWGQQRNWLSEKPVEDWYGVSTDEFGRITGLDLYYVGLRGPLPPAIGDLPHLEELFIAQNAGLSGTMPPALGKLANLRKLYIGGTKLEGPIPGELTNLQELWLHNNNLSGQIPAGLSGQTGLRILRLSGNDFTGCLPVGLPDVADNDLNILGLSICEGTATTTTGVATPATDPVSPATIREVLTALYDATDGPNWHDQGGWFSGRPIDEWHGVSIDATHRLIGLNLSGNRLSGEIPPELGRLTDLKGIAFSGNQLTGEIPPELGNLTNLEGLNLQDNQLTGQLPGALGNLNSFANLNLQGNQLTGQIPAELGNLTNLQSLDLSKNQLNGQIPAALGNLTRLRTLNLNENQLSGQIPAAMGNMTYLARLDLTENQLSGQIPAELGSLPVLFNLTLYGNQFRGCLPPKLDSLANTDVYGFALPYCVEAAPPPTGPAADDRAALVAFADGTIKGRNWLTTAPIGRWEGVKTNDDGRVISLVVPGSEVQPEHLSQLTSLEVLRLGRFRGSIPRELGNLTNLRELSISGWTIHIPGTRSSERYPSLRGEIPAELGNLANLEILRLDSWGWTGEIPAELGNLTNLRELIIRGYSSQLTGGIPVELGNLTQLRRLQLESDLLGGEIPVELGNLVNLETLALSWHAVGGCLPSAFDWLPMAQFQAMGLPFCAK